MKTTTLFQVRFRPSVTPPKGFTKSAHYNVTDTKDNKVLIGNTWLPAKDFIKIEIEDAPVFQKPPLRKIASLKPDEVIECNTDAELKAVLEQAEREGLIWYDGTKPLKFKPSTPVYIQYKFSVNNQMRLTQYPPKLMKGHTPLPASKFVEVGTKGVIEDLPTGKELIQRHIDAHFEKPQGEIEPPTPELKPFPEGYVIPKGTICVNLIDLLWGEFIVPKGSKLKSLQDSFAPYLELLGGEHRDDFREDFGGYFDAVVSSKKLAPLAPLDPRDHPEHPEHPEFGKQKQKEKAMTPEQFVEDVIEREDPITQAQKDECVKLQERIKELEALCELRQQDSDNFADDLTDCNELINRMKELAKSSLSVNNDMLNRAALRAIANGEI